jgi:hypothetical protein
MRLFWALCLICGWSIWSAALDREAFTFTKYDLQIQLEPEQHRLGARGKLTLRNDSAQPQKNAVLQISSSLSWRSIKMTDKPLQFVSQPYVSDIDHTGSLSEAIVTLPAEVKPRETVELDIGYEGTIALDATRLTQIGVPEAIAKHTSWDQISPGFSAVRGAGYVAWYPIATEAADFSEGNSLFEVKDRWQARVAESSMHINLCSQNLDRVPLLAMNEVAGAKGEGGGFDHHSCVGHTFNRLGITAPEFVVGDLHEKAIVPGALFLDTVSDTAAAQAYAYAAKDAAPFVTAWFGPSNTFSRIVTLPDPRGASFENGTILFSATDDVYTNLAALNVVHMLVHSTLQSPRPWIHEGLAHFAEVVYREREQDGRAAALVFLNLHGQTLVDAEKTTFSSPNAAQPLATTFDENFYRTKAAYVWWMLHDMIGDDALKAAIQKYRAQDDKDPKYMQQLVEAASRRDLNWFFDDWVYHDRGLPDFHVASVHPWKSDGDKQIVTVTIENLGSAGAEVPFRVRYEGGEIPQKLEVRGKSSASIRVEVPGAAQQVIINDGSVPESDLTNNVFEITSQ